MAHFRAVIQGARGEASRLGTKKTGIYARVQTWGKDLAIQVTHDEQTGEDVATVWLMPHGSPSETPNEQVARFVLRKGA
jgi:hypothetical protein